MMISVAYVVLHYQALEETEACVKSIKKNHGVGDTFIVVVDNASPNGSGRIIEQDFCDDNSVIVIQNTSNLGFANGLNVGIEYVRNHLKVDFIVLLNNDTELISENWDNTIIEKYNELHFAALGPDIVSMDGKTHANPSRKQDYTEEGIKKILRKKKKEIVLYRLYLMPISICIRSVVKKLIKYTPVPTSAGVDKTNIQLQGSCIILSPLYFDVYDSLYKRTFLYFEEAILRYRCEKIGSACAYTPSLVLLHKGSVSVNSSMKNFRQKQLFYLKHSSNSCHNFLEDLINGNE